MLSSLNATLEAEFNRPLSLPIAKAADPYDFLSTSAAPLMAENVHNEQQIEQHRHYRGRFHSAAKIIVRRFAMQPVRAGVVGGSSRFERQHQFVKAHALPVTVPDWIWNPEQVQIVIQHPALFSFFDPNPYMTSYQMKEMFAAAIMVTGQGFIVAFDSESPAKAYDLYPIPPHWMSPVNEGGFRTKWKIKPPGVTEKAITVDASQVAHSYFTDPENPFKIISPMVTLARDVLADESIIATQYNEFKNGVTPKHALIAGDVMNESSFTDDPNRSSAARPVRLEPEQRQQIVTWFKQQYAGVQRHGLPIVLDAVIRDIKEISRKPAEMAFRESAGLTKEQIFEGLGVSRILTGQLESANRAAGGLAEQFFVDYTLNPLLTMVSQSFTKTLGKLFSAGENLVLWMSPAVAKDTELEIEYLRLAIRSYAITRNDVRNVINRQFGIFEPLDGFDDVVMPQTLDERDDNFVSEGVGRIALDQRD